MKISIEQLETISPVEVSPYLYKRILNAVERKASTIDRQEIVYWAIPCLCIVLLTIFIISSPSNNPHHSIDLIQSMHLESVNTLY